MADPPDATTDDGPVSAAAPRRPASELDLADRRRLASVVESLTGTLAASDRLGRFEVERLLGEGAFGEVFLGRDVDLARPVALKLLKRSATSDALRRLKREAQAMAALDHPALLTVYEIGTAQGRDYIAMELAEGGTLGAWVNAQARSFEAIAVQIERAARGLAVAHEAGFVHRDVKPSNILVGADGHARVSDFGLVHAELRSGETPHSPHSTNLAGTPVYMAPEQFDEGDPTPAADQYALCVTLYELVYGQRPLKRPPAIEDISVPELRDAAPRRVPTWLRTVLVRGLRFEPSQRFATTTDLADALARGIASRRRRRTRISAVAAVAAAAAVGWAARPPTAERGPTCGETARATMASVWSSDRARDLKTALTSNAPAYAAQLATATIARLDRRSAAWIDAKTQTCEDERPAAAESTRCLDDQRRVLDATLRRLVEEGTDHLDVTARALARSLDVAHCEQTSTPWLRPLAGQDAETAAQLEHKLDEADAALTHGAVASAATLAEQVFDGAQALDAPRLVARAGRLLANSLLLQGDSERAIAPALEGFHASLGVGLDVAASDSAITLAIALGQRTDPQGGVRWARVGVTLAARAGRSVRDRAAAVAVLSRLQTHSGDIEAGATGCDNAIAMAGTDDHDALPLSARIRCAKVWITAGRYDDAAKQLGVVVEEQRSQLGPQHPLVGESLIQVAAVLDQQGRAEEAYATAKRATDVLGAAFGSDAPALLTGLTTLSGMADRSGRRDEALKTALRGANIARAHLVPSDPRYIQIVCLAGAWQANTDCALAQGYATDCTDGLDALAQEAGREPPLQTVAALVQGRVLAANTASCLDDPAPRQRALLALEPYLDASNVPFELQGIVLMYVAEARLDADRPVEAEALMRRAFAGDTDATTIPARRGLWHTTLAKALLAQQRRDEAVMEARRAEPLLAQAPVGDLEDERQWIATVIADEDF